MLAVQPTSTKSCTPNLLPARVHHTGPINDTQRYWKPAVDDKGTRHAYFRGRHLHGTSVPLPAGYTGAVLQSTDKTIPRTRDACRSQGEDQDGDMDDEEDDEETKITEQVATFDEVVVWEHGARVDVERDAYVRGLGEWVEWAGVMHAKDEDEGEGGEDGGEKA